MRRILLLEDDEMLRESVGANLEDAGYQVDYAASAAAAGELLDRGGYDLLLADIKVPGGTGLDVADRAAAKGVKVLIVSGYAFALSRPDLMRYDCLQKPVGPKEILAAIADKIGVARA
jgi:DNA-binding response OmpR family regulator